MIVFDTEDDSAELLAAGKSGFDKRVIQIAAISDSGDTFHNRGNVKEFWDWLKETGEKSVWAFNAPYDIGNLCNSPSQGMKLDQFDLTMVKGRFIKAKLDGISFFDVHNLSGAGSSVAKLGDAVGLKKLDGNFRSRKYVLRDCEIPMRWLKFVERQCLDAGIETIPATLGGLCVKMFSALDHHNWFEASDWSGAALKGGRVELFSAGGDGNIIYVDINSLYPFCMTKQFPDCMENLNGSLKGFGVAECSVSVPKKLRVAPLPFHDPDGRMIFPVGNFSGVWTLHEIRAAQEMGVTVKKVKWSYGSPRGESYYKQYILEFYKRRLAAKNESEKLFYKLLLNNLYGRLAISGEVTRSLNLTAENCSAGIPYGRKILLSHKMPLPPFTNYLHAAHVLAYARLLLMDYLNKIPPESLIYCDTDSMIFFWPKNSPLPFPVNSDLGQMKLESIGTRCETYLPKTYHFAGHDLKGDAVDQWKAKGVPKKHARTFIETGSAEFDLPFKLRESIRFFDAKNSRKLSVWRKVEKIRHAQYDRKRIVGNFYLPKIVNL